jgi:phage shock protein A
MALLERVGTLLRANLNDLVDRAEDPEKMLKQVILDMENQLMQVKTQVAIGLADQHLLERRATENRGKEAEWIRKAELAVAKQQDDLARIAIERSLEGRKLAESFDQQVLDQRTQVENLKSALRSLDAKLAEARATFDVLMAKHRRAKAAGDAADARNGLNGNASSTAWDRMNRKVDRAEAVSMARHEMAAGDGIEERFAALEKADEVDRLLAELKGRA